MQRPTNSASPLATRRDLLCGSLALATTASAVPVLASCQSAGAPAWQTAVERTWAPAQSGTAQAGTVQWRAALLELVRYGTLAANSHNSQPWRFIVAADSIDLRPDFDRRLPAVDPDNHHLFASLGCAVENIVQAAPAFGLAAAPRWEDGGFLRIALTPGQRNASELFEAIPRRQCTRGVYDGRPVAPEVLERLQRIGASAAVDVRLFTAKPDLERIKGLLIAGNSVQMEDRAFVEELKVWIRFSYGEAVRTRDGLFGAASGNPVVPEWLGRLLFGFVFTEKGENAKYVQHLDSSAGVAAFIAKDNDPAHWIEAGRACQRFALQLTALGLRYAFINQVVEVPAVRAQFAAFLDLPDRRPDLVLRFGYGTGLPHALRRPVEDVAQVADHHASLRTWLAGPTGLATARS